MNTLLPCSRGNDCGKYPLARVKCVLVSNESHPRPAPSLNRPPPEIVHSENLIALDSQRGRNYRSF